MKNWRVNIKERQRVGKKNMDEKGKYEKKNERKADES